MNHLIAEERIAMEVEQGNAARRYREAIEKAQAQLNSKRTQEELEKRAKIAQAQQRSLERHQDCSARREERRRRREHEFLESRKRTFLADQLFLFLEELGLHTRAAEIVAILRPALDRLTTDEVLEYVTNGTTEIPQDMLNDEIDVGEPFSPFWAVASRESHVEAKATPPLLRGSLHRRLRPLLDLFDYGENLDELRELTISHSLLKNVFPEEVWKGVGFDDAAHAAHVAASKGLVRRQQGEVVLTKLGFAYHCAFARPEQSASAILSQKRQTLDRLRERIKWDEQCDDGSSSDGSRGVEVLERDSLFK
jgi:hypothetical protein